uniref:Si:dkey-183c6.8 n=1 Tax=Sphaeramia orbicularis TaxID=375764 RepID=A0A673CSL1_9TELE
MAEGAVEVCVSVCLTEVGCIFVEATYHAICPGNKAEREREMQRWGLNTYLYGPKDDLKHRLLWREVYSPEEEAQLRTLIKEAQSRGLRFVYALSPGQDIVFSSSCDLTLLKRKLRQVHLGCQAFAILFDDIDHSMCQADSEAFSSFAHAQVTVTNEIYRFLGEPPVFLFCPTEYCGSLCSPSVSKSPYLQTVGEDLLPNITVIWTGSKVISRKLSMDCLAEVESVLQRPPLIWDNLHANDYDSRRLFLGPFKGREPQLRSQLRGLLLNPNCEFEANYIPLHTLGSWYRAGKEERKGEGINGGKGGRENEECEYCPDRALSAALRDWMEELNQPLQAGNRLLYINTALLLGEREGRDLGEKKRSNQSSQPNHQGPGSRAGAPAGGGRGQKAQGRVPSGGKGLLTESQVRLLVGLHYLPHEHGPSAQKLLQDLTWLKSNCHLVSANSKKAAPQKVSVWISAVKDCVSVTQLHCSVVGGANRAVLYDLYPYVWDLRNTALVAKAFICWLGKNRDMNTQFYSSILPSFLESEPWVFKGGVSGEVQMLLPIGSSSELFTHPPPLFPTSRLYNIRPYHSKDKVREATCINIMVPIMSSILFVCSSETVSSVAHPDVIGDRCLGPCLALCPEYSFILEDELGVCGCVLGILDVRSFAKRCQASWMPAMRDKYPPKVGSTHPNTQVNIAVVFLCVGSQGVFCEVQPTDRQRLEFLTKLGFLEILRGEARSREGVVLGRLL